MELHGAVVVVTGGGSGIGAALVERITAEAPSAMVVVDQHDHTAARVRDQVAAKAPDVDVWHAAVDVADEDQVQALVRDVERRNGTIDLFCANAGIGSAMGLDAPDEVWRRVMDVNVMSHLYAARALVPGWCERGRGHLLVTASAAGLLSNLGDAPYSVSKHAAVALAEWISITYGGRGVGVSCLCPQGVRTPLLFGTDEAGGLGDGTLATEVVKAQRILEPAEVAEVTVAALTEDRFLILPHEEVATYEQARATDRERWLGSMRRLQDRLDAT
jgi:NAD(P)-dependent dehydrogenase (short-subunit alcohol dehydrogenase family)